MKASELKVGNWLYHLRKFQVTGIDTTWVEYVYTAGGKPRWDQCLLVSDKLKPIPLTEEWLVKMGGIKPQLATCIYFPAPNIKAEIHFTKFRGGLVCEIYCSTGVIIPNDIKYVHQLQNLYFALTGEELTIKEV